MTLHTAEPLYAIDFPRGVDALAFVDEVRTLAASPPGLRITPLGPVVIFGPIAIEPKLSVRLYVTRSVLRACTRAGLTTPPIVDGLADAVQLPLGAVVLFATLGDGADGSWRDGADDREEHR